MSVFVFTKLMLSQQCVLLQRFNEMENRHEWDHDLMKSLLQTQQFVYIYTVTSSCFAAASSLTLDQQSLGPKMEKLDPNGIDDLKKHCCESSAFLCSSLLAKGSYHSLRRWSANMDVLVALGTNAAYFYSVYVVIRTLTSVSFKGQDFFETSSMLISFILLGKYLEIMAKGKTSAALEKRIQLIPDKAYLLDIDVNGNVISETEIDTSLIEKNDIIKIVPGAKIPVDGLVIKGKSYANESMITGESRPVNKIPRDILLGDIYSIREIFGDYG